MDIFGYCMDMFVCAVAILSHQVATNCVTFVFDSLSWLLIRSAVLVGSIG